MNVDLPFIISVVDPTSALIVGRQYAVSLTGRKNMLKVYFFTTIQMSPYFVVNKDFSKYTTLINSATSFG